jgi:hypothetical protein
VCRAALITRIARDGISRWVVDELCGRQLTVGNELEHGLGLSHMSTGVRGRDQTVVHVPNIRKAMNAPRDFN